jgi:plasmid stability protein
MIDRCEDCLQNACMPSISVRNVPEATRDALAAKAAQAGQSLQEYLLARLIEIGRTRDIEVLLGEMKEIRKRWPKQVTREQILEALDEGRREADEKWDRLWG